MYTLIILSRSHFFFILSYIFKIQCISIITLALFVVFGQPSDVKELDFEFSLEDLETIKVIGKGSGGVVQLVRHKWVGKLFALKVYQQNQF
jgi:hypothetical protein